MRSQGDVLGLLESLGVYERKAALPYGADFRKVCIRGLQRHMEDDRVLCELVEVRYGREEDGGRSSD
jgi:hypothetical protein